MRKFSESESWSIHEDEVTGKFVAYKKDAEKHAVSSISENSENPEAERRKWLHDFCMSSSHMDKKKIRLCERLTMEDPRTKWTTST